VRVSLFLLPVAFGVIGVLLVAMHRPLPHRPPTLNHGQGHSTLADGCPRGSRPYYVYADDGTKFFEECIR
jgi:hypothetical protein